MDGGLRDLVDTSYSTFESTDRAIKKGTKKSGCTFLGKGFFGKGNSKRRSRVTTYERLTTAHHWRDGYFTSISICGVLGRGK